MVDGAGEHFSSGHDLGTPEQLDDWKERGAGCGLGPELAVLLPLMLAWRSRRLTKRTAA